MAGQVRRDAATAGARERTGGPRVAPTNLGPQPLPQGSRFGSRFGLVVVLNLTRTRTFEGTLTLAPTPTPTLTLTLTLTLALNPTLQ